MLCEHGYTYGWDCPICVCPVCEEPWAEGQHIHEDEEP